VRIRIDCACCGAVQWWGEPSGASPQITPLAPSVHSHHPSTCIRTTHPLAPPLHSIIPPLLPSPLPPSHHPSSPPTLGAHHPSSSTPPSLHSHRPSDLTAVRTPRSSPNNYTGELDAPVTEAEGPPLVASARTKSGLKEGSSLGAALKKRRSRHHSSRFLPVALGGQSSPSSSRRANSREAVKTAAPSPQQQVPQVKPVAPLFSQIACPSPVASSAVDNNLLMWMSGARPNTRAHAKPHSGQRAQGGHRRWRRWLVGGRDCPGAALASPTGGGSHRALESPRSPMQLVGVSPRSPVTGLSEAALVAQAVREAAREAAAEAAAIKENHEANKVSIRRLSSRESKSERRRKHGERGEAQEADVSERNVSGRDSFPRGSRAEHSIMVAVQQESGESTSGTATACVAAKPVNDARTQ